MDLHTEGRLELGLGAGHARSEYQQAGLSFDPFPVRAARLAESVQVLRRLFAGEAVSFAGEHYRLVDQQLYPASVQRPRLPLLIGGNSQAVLALAGQHADIVSFTGFGQTRSERAVLSGFTAEATAERVSWVRAAATDRLPALELDVLVQAVVPAENRSSQETLTRRTAEYVP